MIKLIDANCRIGTGPLIREGSLKDTAQILSLMDDFNVEKAVVYHSAAMYSDPLRGNGLLQHETAGQPRFLRQWAVTPALWDLYPQPEEWVARMSKEGVCSVRLFPAQFGHSLKRYAAGRLFDALAGAGLPAFIAFDQLGSWDALYDLCAEYPANTFVLCSPGYRCLRWLVPIMDACPNLYVETSNLLMHDGLSLFCRHMGADRLLFGSGIPEASLAAAASQLCLSDLAEEEKELIASGNITRLLAEVKQ